MSAQITSNNRPPGDRQSFRFESKQWCLFLWMILPLLMAVHAAAQSSPSEQLPEVYAGSVGNEVMLTLTFEEKINANTKFNLTMEESSGVASNVKIVERKDLSSLSKRVFTISFDITGDIEPGKVEKLIFVPSSNQLLIYDEDALQFSFRAVAAEQEEDEEEKASTENNNRGPSLLVLTSVRKYIASQKSVEEGQLYNKNGYVLENCYYDKCDSYMNTRNVVEVEEVPSVIHIGEPFSVKASRLYSMRLPEDGFVDLSMNYGYRVRTRINIDGHYYEAHGLKSMKAGDETRVNKIPGNRDSGWRQTAWSDQEKVSLSLDFIFDGYEEFSPKRDQAKAFKYKLSKHEIEGGKYKESPWDLKGEYYKTVTYYMDTKKTGPVDFYIAVGDLTYTYIFSDDAGSAITVEKFKAPPGLLEGLKAAQTGSPGVAGSDKGNVITKSKTQVSNVVGMSKKQAEKRLQGSGLKTKVSLGSPAPTKKDSLKVERTIPAIGSTVNRGDSVTIVIHTPFVDTRTVPEFIGAKAKVVVNKIKDAGLTPKIQMVKAVSSSQTGKVSDLDPSPGTRLKAGATVLVSVFGPYVKTVNVPDVKGDRAKKGINKIKAAGLTPKINMVKATSAEQANRVSSLDPPAGTELKAGATILVNVFGPYVRTVDVPSIEGLSEKAALKKLSALGLQANITGSKKTDSSSLAGTIVSQMPEAGTTVKEGKNIDLVVYKQSRPDCTKWPGSAPLWNQKKNKYECDCTGDYERNNANSACRVKKSIQLARANCTDYNNQSEARWDGENEKVYCYCNEGYKWNKDKTACEMNRETIIANTDCSSGGYYGEAYWNYERNEASCRCKSGYKLNSSGKCVGITYSRAENDQPYDQSRSDDVDLQQLADDLMTIFGDKKKGRRNKRDTRASQKTTRKNRTQNNCGSNFSVNGSRIDCKCAGWGFDPKYSQCRKGFSDKYSSKTKPKSGQVYAGFGNTAGSSGKLHACKDRNVRVDAIVLKYAPIYGGGETSYEMKGNMVCYSNSYDIISRSSIESYTCRSENFGNCSRRVTTKIERRKDKGGGAYSIHFNGGNAWWTINPR